MCTRTSFGSTWSATYRVVYGFTTTSDRVSRRRSRACAQLLDRSAGHRAHRPLRRRGPGLADAGRRRPCSACTSAAGGRGTRIHCRTSRLMTSRRRCGRVRELGGEVIHPGARWAVCRDSEGSPFGLAATEPGGVVVSGWARGRARHRAMVRRPAGPRRPPAARSAPASAGSPTRPRRGPRRCGTGRSSART